MPNVAHIQGDYVPYNIALGADDAKKLKRILKNSIQLFPDPLRSVRAQTKKFHALSCDVLVSLTYIQLGILIKTTKCYLQDCEDGLFYVSSDWLEYCDNVVTTLRLLCVLRKSRRVFKGDAWTEKPLRLRNTKLSLTSAQIEFLELLCMQHLLIGANPEKWPRRQFFPYERSCMIDVLASVHTSLKHTIDCIRACDGRMVACKVFNTGVVTETVVRSTYSLIVCEEEICCLKKLMNAECCLVVRRLNFGADAEALLLEFDSIRIVGEAIKELRTWHTFLNTALIKLRSR